MAEYSAAEIKTYYQSGGPVAKAVPGFVYREEQVQLAEGIANAFKNSEFLISEVGTGVGKTFGYLIPAFLWALSEKVQVVISTRTKALQQQIVDRDIPDLLKVMDFDLKVAEAKGRENYLCWNKYRNILAGRKTLNEEEQEFITVVLNWAERTRTGDRKELDIDARLLKHWPLLSADRRNCHRDQCRYHEKCLRMKMLKNLQKADIIVVNHSLLLSDLQVNNAILPDYKYLIIDEAHNFDRESFDKLALHFPYVETGDILRTLYIKDKKYARGLIPRLKGLYAHLTEKLSEINTLVARTSELLDHIFSILTFTRIGRESDFSMVIEERHMEENWFAELVDVYLDWQMTVRLLLGKLKEIKEEIGEGEDAGAELGGLMAALQEYSDQAFFILEENIHRSDSISWIEYKQGGAAALSSSHIMIGDILNEQLYHRLESLVMVSATLAVEDRFDYFLDKNGLMAPEIKERVNTLLQKSPFDYAQQAMIFSVKDMPDPSSPEHSKETAQVLLNIMESTGGGILVLFTARRQLQEVAAILRPMAGTLGMKLLVQEDTGTSGSLLDEFASSGNAVLLGLETFWEGIDVKGDALRCVVIVKLPFRSPSDPFCIAGDKYCRSHRRNSFQHFMLPDGTMRFKQGTGRLIRSETDRGVVVVLDNRLEKSRYGSVFKNSIPIHRCVVLKKNEVGKQIQNFLGGAVSK